MRSSPAPAAGAASSRPGGSSPEVPPVAAAGVDLNHVLLTLVVNAAHAIEDAVAVPARRGVIAIRTAREGDMAVVEVRDSGCGIPADVRERVFEPFFTTKEVGRGSGQGLPIARTLMTRHGGRIDFASTPSAGSTFRVEIPIHASAIDSLEQTPRGGLSPFSGSP